MSMSSQLITNPTMVNYTNVLTSAPNEIYISTTGSPDSLASLMKDTIIIEFSLKPIEENKDRKDEGKPVAIV